MTLCRVRATATGVAGSPYYMNMHFDLTPEQAQAGLDTLHYFLEQCKQYFSNQMIWKTDPLVVYLDPLTGQPTSTVTGVGATTTGLSSTQRIASASQFLIRWRTQQFPLGREIVGHTYLPGPTTTNLDGSGGVISTAVTALTTAAQNTIDVAGNATPVVYSRKNGAFYEATTGKCWEKFAVLRSRRD